MRMRVEVMCYGLLCIDGSTRLPSATEPTRAHSDESEQAKHRADICR